MSDRLDGVSTSDEEEDVVLLSPEHSPASDDDDKEPRVSRRDFFAGALASTVVVGVFAALLPFTVPSVASVSRDAHVDSVPLARDDIADYFAAVESDGNAVSESHFITSENLVRSFRWTPPTRTVHHALSKTFIENPDLLRAGKKHDSHDDHGSAKVGFNQTIMGKSNSKSKSTGSKTGRGPSIGAKTPPRNTWTDWSFSEGGGAQVTLEALAKWVENELLGGPDPFALDGKVPVPWPEHADRGDQLGAGEWVGYTRRQVCFIVAKSLVGSNTIGYANGLYRFLDAKPDWAKCTPRTGDFGKSLFGLLAACSVDPGLANGGQGPMLIVAKSAAPEHMDLVREASRHTPLSGAGLRVCQYDDGTKGPALQGIPAVPSAGCAQPSSSGPGRDFMTGGAERLQGQAIQDISAAFIGGYIFGGVCGLGGGQDERLLVYMPEVTALTFFLSEAVERPQLRVPAWVLGARMLFTGLDGTGRFGSQLRHDPDVPLRADLVTFELAGKRFEMSSSRPFVAFMSETQAFLGEPESKYGSDVRLARRNKHSLQRETSSSIWFSFEKQVRAWYTGVALTSYHRAVRPLLQQVVHSVGTGPWLAGVWWGDSQIGFLATWLGHALAAPTWGAQLSLDYYIYSTFTENPGNQCFVHAKEQCEACLQQCNQNPLPPGAYWLPDWALFLKKGKSSQCAGKTGDCGQRGLAEVVANYGSASVADLWDKVEAALRDSHGSNQHSVFDLLRMRVDSATVDAKA